MDGIYLLLLAGLAALSFALLKLCASLGPQLPADGAGEGTPGRPATAAARPGRP